MFTKLKRSVLLYKDLKRKEYKNKFVFRLVENAIGQTTG